MATPGWVNLDRSPNVVLDRLPAAKQLLRSAHILGEAHMARWDREVVRHDIRRLNFVDGSVDAVYSSHALEHLYLDEARRVIQESYRVLRAGGILRLALPDAERNARELLKGIGDSDQDAGSLYNSRLLTFPDKRPGVTAKWRSAVAGHIHRWQPSAPMVFGMMSDAGFEDIRRCEYRIGNLPDVETVETRPESFFVEGRKN